eukprot:TRINITY_DN37451_c0_g1_i1.p1 TRINITY_DN37451_c0_g1~~TRINITY_DN37451_c0_g1_i1.p1  ORF type:complete len:323 (-),score=97.75 TRINITY_DN37451_c0_g1_i1:89-1057(-)
MARRAALLTFSSCLAAARAWGPDGHAIVAAVADRLLSQQAAQTLTKDLGADNISVASDWCDDFDHRDEGRWSEELHFINYPGKSCSFDWARDCVQDKCAAGAIVNYTKQVMDKSASKSDRFVALKFVLHMMGDIHQPLHVGSGDDEGGNLIKVSDHFVQDPAGANSNHNKKTNLHAVWDDAIIVTYLAELEREGNFPPGFHYHRFQPWVDKIVQRLQEKTSQELSQWQATVAGGVTDEQKFRSGLTEVGQDAAHKGCTNAYVTPDGKPIQTGATLGRDYYERNLPIVEEQLAKAGARLAQVLSEALLAPFTLQQQHTAAIVV